MNTPHHTNSTKSLGMDVSVLGYSDDKHTRVVCSVISGASFLKVHVPVSELAHPLPADLQVIELHEPSVSLTPAGDTTPKLPDPAPIVQQQVKTPALPDPAPVSLAAAAETVTPAVTPVVESAPVIQAAAVEVKPELPKTLSRGKKPQVYVRLGSEAATPLMSCKEALEFARKHGAENVRVAPAIAGSKWYNSLDYFLSFVR